MPTAVPSLLEILYEKPSYSPSVEPPSVEAYLSMKDWAASVSVVSTTSPKASELLE